MRHFHHTNAVTVNITVRDNINAHTKSVTIIASMLTSPLPPLLPLSLFPSVDDRLYIKYLVTSHVQSTLYNIIATDCSY